MDSEIMDELNKSDFDRKLMDNKVKLAKESFVNEMRQGLGITIKKNPYYVKFYVKPWYVKFYESFKKIIIKIFTKF